MTLINTVIESHRIKSRFLKRTVTVDLYFPPKKVPSHEMSLLLINDGQDLVTMDFFRILDDLYKTDKIEPLLCVGIHCGADRRNEYGTIDIPDFRGRGAKAGLYRSFIFDELLPFLKDEYGADTWKEKAFCGFSLGGLSALDIVWSRPYEFSTVGVFSGSLWWRLVDQDEEGFDEEEHRIMHLKIRTGGYYPGLKFYFETGTKDEVADRNNNGIIDSIDDTQALIRELAKKGYYPGKDIFYLELKDGRHDVPTWARALPVFLNWAWGQKDK